MALIYGDENEPKADVLVGTAGNDTIAGFLLADRLFGGGGIDLIFGGDGNDRLIGGSGNDNLVGDDDNDRLWGEGGRDNIGGGKGVDVLFGGIASDSMAGGEGNDVLWGEDGDDELYGNEDNDLLSGDVGNDKLDGGDGADIVRGGTGNDTLYGGLDADIVEGGAGDDVIFGNWEFSGPSLPDDAAADSLFGDEGKDSLWGNRGGDELYGGADDDALHGHSLPVFGLFEDPDDAGADTLNGGAGDDTLFADLGDDVYIGGADRDLVDFSGLTRPVTVDLAISDAQQTGAGNDRFEEVEDLIGTDRNDKLRGDGGNNWMDGGAGQDYLDDRLGNDTLYGGAGNDLLELAGGDDDAFGGIGSDEIGYTEAAAGVRVSLLSGGRQDTRGAGHDLLRGFEDLSGSRFNDILQGNNAANVVSGGAGRDRIFATFGADDLLGGRNADVFVFETTIESFGGDTDTIRDFTRGDRIDVSRIDADAAADGNQTFNFIGSALFALGTPGQLRFSGNVVSGDVNGDGTADVTIHVAGAVTLSAADFIL